MPNSLSRRIELLEEAMDRLVGLPDRIDALEGSLHALEKSLRDDMHALEVSLRQEIRSGDEETRRFMRILHEDLVGRIAVLGERLHNAN